MPRPGGGAGAKGAQPWARRAGRSRSEARCYSRSSRTTPSADLLLARFSKQRQTAPQKGVAGPALASASEPELELAERCRNCGAVVPAGRGRVQ